MTVVLCVFFFFFSSRRRHTRFKCDWSSDVCSSDLKSSRRTTAKVEAVKPCLRAFWAERVLPSWVRGPVEWEALARLAASCRGEGSEERRGGEEGRSRWAPYH